MRVSDESVRVPVLRPAKTSMRVVLPAPDTPIRQVSTPGRKQPLMSVRSTSCGLEVPSTVSPTLSEPCIHVTYLEESHVHMPIRQRAACSHCCLSGGPAAAWKYPPLSLPPCLSPTSMSGALSSIGRVSCACAQKAKGCMQPLMSVRSTTVSVKYPPLPHPPFLSPAFTFWACQIYKPRHPLMRSILAQC